MPGQGMVSEQRSDVKIVIFAHKTSGQRGRQLVESISSCHLPQSLLKLQTLNALKTYLKGSGEDSGGQILLLLAETRSRLADLTALADLLEDRRLILVVPDGEPATLSIGNTLFPRFFTPLADRYDDLCAVVVRMAANAAH